MSKGKKSSEIARTAIDDKIKLTLWGRAAGRCEICNKLLYCDSKYGDPANFAEFAHIHAVGMTGPRHRNEITQDEINQIDNLMLLCEESSLDRYKARRLFREISLFEESGA